MHMFSLWYWPYLLLAPAPVILSGFTANPVSPAAATDSNMREDRAEPAGTAAEQALAAADRSAGNTGPAGAGR